MPALRVIGDFLGGQQMAQQDEVLGPFPQYRLCSINHPTDTLPEWLSATRHILIAPSSVSTRLLCLGFRHKYLVARDLRPVILNVNKL